MENGECVSLNFISYEFELCFRFDVVNINFDSERKVLKVYMFSSHLLN